MSITSEPKRCPKCGGLIPAEAPQGLCPKCLLLQAAEPTDGGKGETSGSVAPAGAELGAAFPQLEILELIGQGGMGFVFKARQPKLDRFVALKILPQSLAADPAFSQRFSREGRVLARLNHPNIVTIHDFGQANGFFYLLMEFVDGVNLRQAMRVGRFTPAQALAIVPKICEALQFAHNEGILHRDIKPENILLDTKGRVKIADFGIAKLVGADAARAGSPRPAAAAPGDQSAHGVTRATALTETGKVLGTPQYMAPEQLEQPQDVDQRADIYSLGVVFYEMLTGELPVGRFAPPSERSPVDPRVDEVVLRTLEKERERRQHSAGELKMQVETIAATPDPSSSRREEAQIEFAKSGAEWGKRRPLLSPFQSPEVREICAHLTKAESNQVSLLGFLCGVWIVAAVFGIPALLKSFPSPGNWIVGSVLGIIFVVTLPMLSRIGRQLLCSTAWAKVQGFTPAQLRLFSFRGSNLWKGLAVLLVLLALLLVQRKTITRYFGLSASSRQGVGSATAPGAGTVVSVRFGPEKEVTLTEFNNRDGQEAVDLDTGTLLRQPTEIQDWSDPAFGRWVKENGVDLLADQGPGGVWGLLTSTDAELKVALLEEERWDGINGPALATALVNGPAPLVVQQNGIMKVYIPPKDARLPLTLAFKTSTGGEGLLQIIGDSESPRGIKVRYKLVRAEKK